MLTKTLFALVTAIVLSVSFVSVSDAQTRGHGCVSANLEEGFRSAIPAWRFC